MIKILVLMYFLLMFINGNNKLNAILKIILLFNICPLPIIIIIILIIIFISTQNKNYNYIYIHFHIIIQSIILIIINV